MRDIELYQRLLGLRAPWTVAKVELNETEQRVDVWVEHPAGLLWPCPKCAKDAGLYDHEEERVWRHLDSLQWHTFLHARPPRLTCAEHGVLQVRLPWAEPKARFTALFEHLAIDVLRETHVTGAGRILGLSWDEGWNTEQRAVDRGLAAKEPEVMARLSVDEKAIAKGQTYVTIVCNIDKGTVEYVADDRKKESLDDFYQGLTPEQLAGIEAVSMDMWAPFIASTREHVPDAASKMVFDRFHVMKHMNESVDKVRRVEHRLLSRGGAESPLKGSKNLWLYAGENVPGKHHARFAALKRLHLKTGRAWAIKESLRELWEYKTPGWAIRHWKQWYHWAMCSRLPPVVETARMIKDHLANVLTFITHRITTATSEGLNSRIEVIKNRACGYRNREHFKTAILFHCGGLNLYPALN